MNFKNDVIAIHTAIASHIRKTPLWEIKPDDLGLSGSFRLFLKLELFQYAGSFKARGAFANLMGRDVPPAGVAAASGGNHGAAVAYAASHLGHPASIFVPEIASSEKIARIRSAGAALHIVGTRYVDALEACERFIAETGAMNIHAYDQYETLVGQATLARETEMQFEATGVAADTFLVAVGGGGLIGGTAGWLEDRAAVIAVEPSRSCALASALAAGHPVDVDVSGVAADSLGARRVGDLMFPIARRHVDRSCVVPDEAITHAQSLLWERLRLVAEPGGATALAALLARAYEPATAETVCVIVCGSNTDAVRFSTG